MDKVRKIVCIALTTVAGAVFGQSASVEESGIRFPRWGLKEQEALASKAGGPTERFEIQSTDDHRDYVVKAYALENANAAELVEVVQLALELEEGRVTAISNVAPGILLEGAQHVRGVTRGERAAWEAVDIVGFEPNALKETDAISLLVVTMPEWMVPYMDETITRLDRTGFSASEDGTVGVYVRPKYRQPTELATLIESSAAGEFTLVVPDDSRQMLYIEDLPSYLDGDLEALQIFDHPVPQIETRVRIYEIQDSVGKDVGLDWQAWKKSIDGGGLNVQWDNAGAEGSASGSYDLNLQSLSAELSFNPLLATEFLNYLAQQGQAEVITDTRLTQTNGRPAVVKSVSAVPYVVRGLLNGHMADQPARDVPQAELAPGIIREFQEGVEVEMTPRIADDIEIVVRASVASHVGYTPNQSVPIISESSVDTVLLLEPGKTAVMGGLSREGTVTERSGIWGLKALPGIQHLFSREVERQTKSLILVTVELNHVHGGARDVLAEKRRPSAGRNEGSMPELAGLMGRQ